MNSPAADGGRGPRELQAAQVGRGERVADDGRDARRPALAPAWLDLGALSPWPRAVFGRICAYRRVMSTRCSAAPVRRSASRAVTAIVTRPRVRRARRAGAREPHPDVCDPSGAHAVTPSAARGHGESTRAPVGASARAREPHSDRAASARPSRAAHHRHARSEHRHSQLRAHLHVAPVRRRHDLLRSPGDARRDARALLRLALQAPELFERACPRVAPERREASLRRGEDRSPVLRHGESRNARERLRRAARVV